jgi:hypothetical protein
MKFKKILKENIISKIINFYKKSFLFGSSLGIKTAYWLKNFSIPFDKITNMCFDLIVIIFNIILIWYWFILFSNKLTIFFMYSLISIHTIIVFISVYKYRFSDTKKID